MNLVTLEKAVEAVLWRTNHMDAETGLIELLQRAGLSEEDIETVGRLYEDNHLFILWHLKRAQASVQVAYELSGADTEYLKTELETVLCQLHVLLEKVEREEALLRDRSVLLSDFLKPEGSGLGEVECEQSVGTKTNDE